MSRLGHTLPALGATVLVLVGLSACGSSSNPSSGASSASSLTAGTIAQVNGMPITQTAFDHWVTVAAAAAATSSTGATEPVIIPDPPKYAKCVSELRAATEAAAAKGAKPPSTATLLSECKAEYTNLRGQVMSFLISADWIIGEAGRQKITLTDAKVVSQFQSLKKADFKTPADYTTYLSQSHQTQQDLLLQLKVNDLSADLRARAIKGAGTVSAAQIATYYASHKSTYTTPAKRNLSIILTKTKAQALAAKTAVANGTPFATEAKKVSIDPATKSAGGLEVGVEKGQEEQALDTAVFDAPLNQLSGPVSTPFGYYVFEVHSSTPEKVSPLATVSAKIKSALVTSQEQAKLNKWVSGFTLRWTKLTVCASAFVTQDCKEYKKPAAATGTTGAGG